VTACTERYSPAIASVSRCTYATPVSERKELMCGFYNKSWMRLFKLTTGSFSPCTKKYQHTIIYKTRHHNLQDESQNQMPEYIKL